MLETEDYFHFGGVLSAAVLQCSFVLCLCTEETAELWPVV